MEYATAIRDRICGYPVGIPIITREMAHSLADELSIPLGEARNLVSVNVSRLIEAGIVERFCSGIVYRPERSAFGAVPLDPAELAARLYVNTGEDVVGYVTGAAFLHEVGACTWMPREIEIATNANVRDTKAKLLSVKLLRPKTRVTAENAEYLQSLDAVANLVRLAVDGDDPEGVLWRHVRGRLDLGKLLGMASRYYPTSVVRSLARMAERDAA
ncbi:hypothetical protein [Adlercreutzia sp. ZJ473]|uniref:hypothetical protein n=1 Tax=Adlercreutzia sp. ZJ473 TaxID=2722822 RepID=UPI001557710D|nr:hypothetical protein [Adlercreutzia sp. ZJ473]